ncbi:MAG: hypothetical protein H7X84_06510, partial [Verrucomicrobia bacterium]|nr:hypothetical protein [Prolixibacteraceae bacterium]
VFENDSLRFVYVGKDNPVKQIVWLGDENENHVLIKKGLNEGDVIWLTEPKNAVELKYKGIEIYAEMKKEKEDAKIQADKERDELMKKQPESQPLAASGVVPIKAAPIK